jgi:hypothetical protein
MSSIFALNLAISARAEESGFVWGANGHPFTAYPGVEFEHQLDFLRDIGLTSYRVNVRRIEDIPGLIELNKKAKARNIEILPTLTPALDLDKEEPLSLQKDAYAFAHTIVSRLNGDIKIWELGNELENYAIIKACEMQGDGSQYDCSWGPAGGVGELEYYPPRWDKVSAVLRGLSEGTKDADPFAQRAMGTAGWGHTGAFKRLQKDGVNWDISVWHMYGQDPEWAFKILAQFGKPIWVTEFNHPGGSSKDEQSQAAGLRKQMARLLELSKPYNVRAAHIYELLDETYWEPSEEARMGLVRLERNGTRGWKVGNQKLAYIAVKGFLHGEKNAANRNR